MPDAQRPRATEAVAFQLAALLENYEERVGMHVLISHARLVHYLWQGLNGEKMPAETLQCKAQHLAAIRARRENCLRQISRTERTPALACVAD